VDGAGAMAATRALMPALLALVITGIWGFMIVTQGSMPDSVSNAEFTVLAFYFGSRMAETRGTTAPTNGSAPHA
jgi:hypothetical protein